MFQYREQINSDHRLKLLLDVSRTFYFSNLNIKFHQSFGNG